MSNLQAAEPNRVSIRIAHQGDLDSLLELEMATFTQDRLNRRQLRYLLSRANAATLVAEENGRLIGHVCVLFSRAHSHARIYTIAVDAHARGRGVGTTLLVATEQIAATRHCDDVRLEVHCGNARAIALYRRRGYRQFATVSDYYADHGRALRFAKLLSHPPIQTGNEPSCNPCPKR